MTATHGLTSKDFSVHTGFHFQSAECLEAHYLNNICMEVSRGPVCERSRRRAVFSVFNNLSINAIVTGPGY